MPLRPVLLCGLLVATCLSCIDGRGTRAPAPDAAEPGPAEPARRFKGVTLDAVRAPEAATLERLQRLGVTHLALVSFGFQPAADVPEIRLHTDARWFSESDAGIRTLAAQAAARGMRIVLKPQLWVGDFDAGGQALHRIGFETEADWRRWEAGYRAFLLHYARLAEEIDAALLVVGTELARAARTRPAFWRALIADVRRVYGGPLTYAANWYGEYEDVPFWDALDYVGVQGYFELTPADDPSLDLLHAGWTRPREALARLARKVGRPVLFTEIGYRSVPDAAARPWRWPSRGEQAAPDEALQARLYQAFFESLWHEPWFAGALVWKWHPDEEARHPRHTLGFTPQHKAAETVIGRWFNAR
jgi:hypothetical protein